MHACKIELCSIRQRLPNVVKIGTLHILSNGASQVGRVHCAAWRSSWILVSFWHQMWELESGQSRDLREDGLYGFGEPGSGFRS